MVVAEPGGSLRLGGSIAPEAKSDSGIGCSEAAAAAAVVAADDCGGVGRPSG